MSFLTVRDTAELELLLDPSQRIPTYVWGNHSSFHFLKYPDDKTVQEMVDGDLIKRIDQETEALVVHPDLVASHWIRNPMLDVALDGYRIEGRREFISALEQAKQQLEGMLDKPNSKSGKKYIRYNIKQIQRRVDAHKLGTEHVFLTREQVRKFKGKNNTDLNVFEWTTIIPLLEFGDKYQEALDILENAGVPNVRLFRDLPKRTKDAFFEEEGAKNQFVPYASAYLIAYREDAVEDVIRLLPAISTDGTIYRVNNPNLESIVADKRVQQKISDLGLPVGETAKFLREIGQWGMNFSHKKKKFLKAARSFYVGQLQHKDNYLRWVAVKGISDSYFLDSKSDYRAQRREEYLLNSLFKRQEIDGIITSLGIVSKYPLLVRHRSLLAERFLRYNPHKFEGNDPYDLRNLEKLIPATRRANNSLKNYGLKLNLADFLELEEFEDTKNGVEWIADNLRTEEYQAVSLNPYFRRALNERLFLKILKEDPDNLPHYFNTVREASIKLEELARTGSSEQAERIYDCIFRSFGGLSNGKEDYILTFVELFAGSNINDERALGDFLYEMQHLSRELSHLPKDQRENALRKVRLRERLNKRFGFADYYIQEILDLEILPLNAQPQTIEAIIENGFFPTSLLVERYENAQDKEAELRLWKGKQREISEGKFSLDDALMVDIEYTNFRKAVNSSIGKPNDFRHHDYISMISGATRVIQIPDYILSEVDFLCTEANGLLRYLRQVKNKSNEAGRDLLVIPNYSYGAIALLPIEEILKRESFRIVPARIGSSDCHDNQEYIKEKLFPGAVNNEILTRKPNIVIVDGTVHITADESHQNGRYPDSHQGYLNHIVVVNDILTDNNEGLFADAVLKTKKEIQRLRSGQEYTDAKEYMTFHVNSSEVGKETYYKVGFWNPAGLRLSIRRNRANLDGFNSVPEDVFDASQPRMIIVNSTMPSSAMPQELLAELGEHRPAFFDDSRYSSGIQFKVTPTGVKYHNVLEDKVRQRFAEMFK